MLEVSPLCARTQWVYMHTEKIAKVRLRSHTPMQHQNVNERKVHGFETE